MNDNPWTGIASEAVWDAQDENPVPADNEPIYTTSSMKIETRKTKMFEILQCSNRWEK